MKKVLIVFFGLLFCFQNVYSYKNKRVILLVNKEAQADSLTYNIVDEFMSLVYQNLKTGSLNMWDSPRKANKIDINTIESLEKTFSLKFLNCNNFFIYEKWSSNSRKSSFDIFGFAFSGINKKGEEVNFGYIDYFDISDLLKTNYLAANVDGRYKTSFYHVFMNKAYIFDLISFNDVAVVKTDSKNPDKDFQKGLRIVKKAFNGKKRNLNYVHIQESKLIYYTVKSTDYRPATEQFKTIIEAYFDLHRRELLQYGGESILKSFRETPFLISECRVKEVWIKKKDKIEYELLSIQPYVFGKAFEKEISFEEIRSMNIQDDHGDLLLDVIAKRNFEFHILEINGKEIDTDYSDKYIEALHKTKWDKISYYIDHK